MFLDLVRFWVRPNWWISLPTLLIHNNDTAGGRDLANFQSTCLTTAKKWLKHIHNKSPRNSTHLLIPIPLRVCNTDPHDALWYSVLKQCINLLREQKQRPCDAPLHLHTIGREGTLNMLMPRKSQVPTCFCWWIFVERMSWTVSLLFNKITKQTFKNPALLNCHSFFDKRHFPSEISIDSSTQLSKTLLLLSFLFVPCCFLVNLCWKFPPQKKIPKEASLSPKIPAPWLSSTHLPTIHRLRRCAVVPWWQNAPGGEPWNPNGNKHHGKGEMIFCSKPWRWTVEKFEMYTLDSSPPNTRKLNQIDGLEEEFFSFWNIAILYRCSCWVLRLSMAVTNI